MKNDTDEQCTPDTDRLMRKMMAATLDHFLTLYKNLQFDRQESQHGKLTAALEMINHMEMMYEKLMSTDEELSK